MRPAYYAFLEHLLDQLSLEEKVQLLTGRDFWTTQPIEKIGLRRMLVSDGPSGVRGEHWDERDPSLNLPSATALSSSWDRTIAERYGSVSGVEARRKGVDVVLGPTINLHRSPLGGRHFEAFSEDPLLTAELAAAYVSGVQRHGVGATPKHYVANDFETERLTADVQVSERALRELYLFPFEIAVVRAGAWLVMSAYNSINGATASENPLLDTPLNTEWGFDGVVISDWTAVRSVESAKHAQDLVMPGPQGPWGQALVDAVRTGQVSEAAVDRKVLRMLQLAARVGAIESIIPPAVDAVSEDGVAFAREAAAEGSVLVRNINAELPWVADKLGSLALIGHSASVARTQGGGSATVVPEHVVSPLSAITAALPEGAVTYAVGAIVQEGVNPLPLSSMQNPVTGRPGAHVRFLAADGRVLLAEERRSSALVYFGSPAIARATRFEFMTRYTPSTSGEVALGFAAVGRGRISVNGQLLREAESAVAGTDPAVALLSPPSVSTAVQVTRGEAIDVLISLELAPGRPLGGALGITVGFEPDQSSWEELIAEAVAAARSAEVALVVVGTNARVESEGFDRTSLALPGHQDDLVRAVAAVNPRTVVIVNSGAPVLLPWREEVAAILFTYFGGQEYGHALVDMLFGAQEPGGRLPTTWPASEADVPVLNVTPAHGVIRYDEGIHIGYRAWLKAGVAPAYAFGAGAGYTTWALSDASVSGYSGDGDARVSVKVTNIGARAGKHVVQVYASRAASSVDRPLRWLVGFSVVRLPAGASEVLTIPIAKRRLAYWDEGWVYEPGEFTLHIGSSSSELPLQTALTLGQPQAK